MSSGITHFNKVSGVNGVYVGGNDAEVLISAGPSATSGIVTATLGTLATPQVLTTNPGAAVIVIRLMSNIPLVMGIAMT